MPNVLVVGSSIDVVDTWKKYLGQLVLIGVDPFTADDLSSNGQRDETKCDGI